MLVKRLASLCAAGWLLSAATAGAAPALRGDFIADLEALQQRLQQGETEVVSERALSQARRLAGGNAADRWARALYLQLAAGAAARAGRPEEAAEWLREARETPGVEAEHRDRWQHQEAGLRLVAGQTDAGAELLADWLARHSGAPRDHWRLVRALAELERWEAAADRLTPALDATPRLEAAQQALATTVYRRAGRGGEALALIEAGLEASDDPGDWRQAAALAQRLEGPGRAAAIWEAGWRRGILSGRDDLRQLVRLHLAGGTPARAAEHLEAGLAEELLEDDGENRRLLAQAWEAARDRERALAAWEAVAERSDAGDDWLRLGQLAHAWGQEELAIRALRAARTRGREEVDAWLEALVADAAAREPARD
ncbi:MULTISPECIES: hypothetical protein [Halomonas]|uniref:Tetratricopeptide repeat protein n=1 Tax=Halomonas flagellata TaxID=2920385 RepID=A0ABS9RPN3_9GAMM|nr:MULTISPECIES: hypothetical protein [Halomonas]MCH4561742.1 hypothetical protein [Halomonas flagellata]PXX99470.1 hypothetical protein CR157_01425 [Halomonas sp. LBP4]